MEILLTTGHSGLIPPSRDFHLPRRIQYKHVLNWPHYEPYHADLLHTRVVKAYRAQVRFYREQGKSYNEAQRLALR